MTTLTTLSEHRQTCDELHQLALDENRFLRIHQRTPGSELLDRKRALLTELDRTLEALRSLPAACAREPEARALLEHTRSRILQILQLDRENEQLLLRCSLASSRPAPSSVPEASASMLQKIYSR